LFASLTLDCLASIIIAEIQRVREIKIVDIESTEKTSEVCSKVETGEKRWVKEIRLAKARLQSLVYQERLSLSEKIKGSIKTKPNIFVKKN